MNTDEHRNFYANIYSFPSTFVYRSKLVESEAMALQLKKRNTPVRMSAMSPMMSPISMASSLDICGSPSAMGSSVLLDAKKDLKKLKKMKKSKVSRSLRYEYIF